MESFEEVSELETTALRALLERGRPEQRVWAIWALALRTGAVAGFADGAHGDPDPGVRRTLAVMLAGHGEYDLLVELGRRDPSAAVRESAMQLITRLAAQGALPARIVVDARRVLDSSATGCRYLPEMPRVAILLVSSAAAGVCPVEASER